MKSDKEMQKLLKKRDELIAFQEAYRKQIEKTKLKHKNEMLEAIDKRITALKNVTYEDLYRDSFRWDDVE